MLKTGSLLLSICVSFLLTTDSRLVQIRSLYEKAPGGKPYCEELISLLKPYDETTPLYFGYKGCAYMVMAKHIGSPFSKLSSFRKGKKMLEKAIGADDQNIELRFLRFTIQTNTPSLLGYSGQIKTDRLFLVQHLHQTDSSLRNRISRYLSRED